MARFYANENFRRTVVDALSDLGHDVLTTRDAGNDNIGMDDNEVLEFAKEEQRILLTFNRKHFLALHRINAVHSGIIVCTEDKDFKALAQRIHVAATSLGNDIENQLIRVNRPNE